MAGRLQVDDSVIERRLRPIYDWLDSGNNKKAIQEADKVLRKQPKLQCARVLKGLATFRLGRKEECEALIATVVAETPTDDMTLQALTICYREMHQPKAICKLYENAVKLEPTSEELLSHLFMSHVRIGDYRKQQHAAMQLYKVKPKNPYYFWAIMSIVMQARKNKDEAGKRVSLQIAEKMLTKFIDEGKINSEAEVLTYLYILEVQNKYKEALAVLDGPLAKKVTQQPQNFLSLKKTNYLCKLQQWADANAIYKDLINQEPDNWQYYVQYVSTLSEMSVDSEEPLKEGLVFLRGVWEKAKADKLRFRGPYFGLLQISLCLQERGTILEYSGLLDEVIEHLFHYVASYGDKMCCFADIVKFLPLITKEKSENFLSRVHSLIMFDDSGSPVDVYSVYRHQIWLQLRTYLGGQINFSPEEHVQFAESLVMHYHRTAPLSDDMAITDIRPNDSYLMLAAHSYFEALNHAGSLKSELNPNKILVRLAAVLEHGINISKANFQLKLLLIKTYNLIGATGASAAVYEKLDMKHIQLDTLGYVLIFQALSTANFSLAYNLIANTLKFFLANLKDTSDPMILSYKFGSLTRIPEFVEFRDRLNNSLHFASVTAEHIILEVTHNVNSLPGFVEALKITEVNPLVERNNLSELCDNRDLKVMNTWEPVERRLKDEAIKDGFKADVSLLNINELIIKILTTSLKLTLNDSHKLDNNEKRQNGIMNGDNSSHLDSELLFKHISELEDELSSTQKYQNVKTPSIPVQYPDPPRIYVYARGNYLPYFVKHSQIFWKIYKWSSEPSSEKWNNDDCFKQVTDLTDSLLVSCLSNVSSIKLSAATASIAHNKEGFSHICYFVQTLGLVAILLGHCQTILKPIKSSVTKKSKKKKDNIQMPEVILNYNSYITFLNLQMQKLETSINELLNVTKKNNETNKNQKDSWVSDESFPLPNLDYKYVCDSIEESFESSLQTLSSSISNKVKFINSLKL